MAAYTVDLRRIGSNETKYATVDATNRAEALARAGKKLTGRGRIGLCEWFAGGDTAHVQFRIGGNGNLTGKYIAHVTEEA